MGQRRTSRQWITIATLTASAGLASPAAAQERIDPADRAQFTESARQPAAASQPAAQADAEIGLIDDLDGGVELTAFAEGVDLNVFVEYVRDLLGLNLRIQSPISGTIQLQTARSLQEDELLPLLQNVLDQSGYAISYDEATDFYIVDASGTVDSRIGGVLPTTKLIRTPGIRPQSLQPFIDQVKGDGGAVAYLEELGAILVTASPIRIGKIEEAIALAVSALDDREWKRFELRYVSASSALERLGELLGGQSQSGANRANVNRQNQGNAAAATAGLAGGGDSFDSVGGRLRITADGNALLFRGVEAEFEEVEQLLALIDRPTTLAPQTYFAGSAAQQIAQVASSRGLGEVSEFGSVSNARLSQRQIGDPAGGNPFQSQAGAGGGSAMIVDAERGLIIYYATPEQHQEMAKLVDELEADLERIVIEEYKLEHIGAEEAAEIITQLTGQQDEDRRDNLLPGGGVAQGNDGRIIQLGGSGEGELSLAGVEDVTVVADTENNQLLVSAPAGKQADFKRLIDKLDQRRPQVWVEVQIVSVSDSDSFELAFDTQLINQGGSGGAFATGNGVISAADIVTPATVATGGSVTAGVILSEYVPVALRAAANASGARVVSRPKLLVDDNQEASINNVEQQPTTTTQVGGGGQPNVTSFQGFEDAGTQLTITPRISAGGYLQLDYSIVLSSFIGEGTNGIPSPRLETELSSGGVTVPSDSTVVVGGITNTNVSNGESGVPLLKDIPWIGNLFKSQSRSRNNTTLYVFITPRIMRDKDFMDLELLTLGPQSEVEIETDIPDIEPAIISVTRSAATLGLGPIEDRRGIAPTPSVPDPGPDTGPENEPAAQEPAPDTDPGVVRRRDPNGGDGND